MSQTARSNILVAAVSGGVDSVVMLHLLAARINDGATFQLVVAHVDHGMRPDSPADARFVRALAEYYGLPFELGELHLGEEASEEAAREGRHAYLRSISRKYDRAPIATAHHKGDIHETAIINILRGTGRHGLSSLRSTKHYLRPLINWTRQDIYDYALSERLEWVEDETNDTDRFLRNRIRHYLVPQLRLQGDDGFFNELIEWFHIHNPVLDEHLDNLMAATSEITPDHVALNRAALEKLPDIIQKGLLHHVLRRLHVQNLDSRLVRDLLTFIHTARSGKNFLQATSLQINQTAQWTLLKPSSASSLDAGVLDKL